MIREVLFQMEKYEFPFKKDFHEIPDPELFFFHLSAVPPSKKLVDLEQYG